MTELIEKLMALLKYSFPPPDKIVLERYEGVDGIVGIITSSRFEGMNTFDRIKSLDTIVTAGLTVRERQEILTIVAVTPEEAIAYSA